MNKDPRRPQREQNTIVTNMLHEKKSETLNQTMQINHGGI